MLTQKEKIELIDSLEANYLDFAVRSKHQKPEAQQAVIKTISEVAKGNKVYPPTLNSEIATYNHYAAVYYLQQLLTHNYKKFGWAEKDELVKGFLTEAALKKQNNYAEWQFIIKKLIQPAGDRSFDNFMQYLKNAGVTDVELVNKISSSANRAFTTMNSENKLVDTYFASYIKPKLKSTSSFLGLKKTKGLGSVLDATVGNAERNGHRSAILAFLLEHDPDSVSSLEKYVTYVNYNGECLDASSVKVLLNHNARKYEGFVYGLRSTFTTVSDQISILMMLSKYFPDTYHDQMTIEGEKIFNLYCGAIPDKNEYYSYPYVQGKTADLVYANYLIDRNRAEGIKRLTDYSYDSHYINDSFPYKIHEKLGEDSLPILLNCLNKEYSIVDRRMRQYFVKLFKLLAEFDLSSHTEEIIRFGIKTTPKKYRRIASEALKKYVTLVTPRARQLLEGKVNDRIFGALILQYSEDPEIRKQLMELIDTERNDDTRDIMLDALAEVKFGSPMDLNDAKEMISKADDRKKLSRWGEKWIDESELPKLYWRDGGQALSQKEIRFLFYRSKRVKDISSDIEAKQVIELLDDKKTEKFALVLIKAYQDSNADSKYKYYLIMAGLIGKDAILFRLHTVFNSTVTSKRYRMAAMIVGAIAMVGTDKSLRIVDMIARKFTNKRPQIHRGAKEALDAAAKEMDITMDQLADRIIPNLGFEDHYYHFEAGGDEYRAFVNKEFKLNYFNEDNKLRKSMPKEVSRETKAELKAIEKEIKEVVKTQKGRLENYLVVERTWEVEEWMEYYLNNPIMLIYVQRLLWGVYDENQNLISAFYCDDDLEIYDVADEEVDVEEGTYIRIVHPLHMSEELRNKWKEKVYDMDIEFEFDIINRIITLVPEDEKERNVTKILHGEDIPKGADYVAGFLLKRGWHKSTGDGGRLLFHKKNEKDNVNAYANIDGPAAYYQGGTVGARIYEVSFTEYEGRERKSLQEVSQVFFSEVIADLKGLINA
ncbi:MAG: DUF4132 domain-containing protein [Bacteroidota bacterium]